MCVQELTLDLAEKLALSTLKEAMEDKISDTNIEIARVTKDGYHMYTKEELLASIARIAEMEEDA